MVELVKNIGPVSSCRSTSRWW